MVWPPLLKLEPAESGRALRVAANVSRHQLRRTRFNAGCTVKRSWRSLLAAMLCTTASTVGLGRSIAGSNEIDLTQWTPPDITTIADDPFGTLVKYGHALFTNTANEIGP